MQDLRSKSGKEKVNFLKDSRMRSIIKTISWRTIAIIITSAVSFIITGNLIIALSIGSIDTLIKLLAYYFHERVWEHVGFGRHKTSW